MELCAGVVMAAGIGKRMKSKIPKIFHKICGQEMIVYSIEALRHAGISRIVVVVAPGTQEDVRALLGDTVEYVAQAEPLGTGHAVMQASSLLAEVANQIIVLGSDAPLIQGSTLSKLSAHHVSTSSQMTFLSANSVDSDGLGKVVRNSSGEVVGIVEASEAPKADSGAVQEVNGGAYCFNAPWLWENLPRVDKSSAGEFYLTSLVAMATSQGANVNALVSDEREEVRGINNRIQLAQVEAAMRRRIRERWMLEGVTMIDPNSTFLDASVDLGPDTVIYPNTMVLGRAKIGGGCTIGPGSVVRDSTIGEGCTVVASFLEEATLEDSVEVGPFSHLRPGAYLESGVHIGNFSEIKESRLGRGVAMGHFGYVGDASIGANANLGAGMVTCNYDGVTKHRTLIGQGAFVGCDTMFVAPVEIGPGAVTGAGAVVIEDVPAGRLAVGIPARIRKSKKLGDQLASKHR